MTCEDLSIEPRFILHDRDSLFADGFDKVLATADMEVIKTPYRAPNANVHAERWERSTTEESLNHLVLFGMPSLRRVLCSYRTLFNDPRLHQGLGNETPTRAAGDQARPARTGVGFLSKLKVECTEFLGGLLKSYSLAA